MFLKIDLTTDSMCIKTESNQFQIEIWGEFHGILTLSDWKLWQILKQNGFNMQRTHWENFSIFDKTNKCDEQSNLIFQANKIFNFQFNGGIAAELTSLTLAQKRSYMDISILLCTENDEISNFKKLISIFNSNYVEMILIPFEMFSLNSSPNNEKCLWPILGMLKGRERKKNTKIAK